MGVPKKAYMIVTNDSLELPVASGIRGIEGVAEYLDMPVGTVMSSLHRGSWNKKRKYKAVLDTLETRHIQKTAHENAKNYSSIYMKSYRKYGAKRRCKNASR